MTPPAVSRSHERSPQDAGGAAAAGIPGAALPAVRPRSASHDGDGVGRPSAAIITRAARWSAPSRPRVSAASPASTCRGTRASRRAAVTGGPRGSTRTGRTRSPRRPRRRRSRTNRRVRDGLGIAMDQRQCDAVICGHAAGGRQLPRGVVDSDDRRAAPSHPRRHVPRPAAELDRVRAGHVVQEQAGIGTPTSPTSARTATGARRRRPSSARLRPSGPGSR